MTVPYCLESSGTQKLVDEFFSIMACVHGGCVVVDEMDSGIHDVLMMGVFEAIRGPIREQLVATTHNTTLLQIRIRAAPSSWTWTGRDAGASTA